MTTNPPQPGSQPDLPSIDDQREFWNWHWQNWEQRKVLNDWTERRAKEILAIVESLHLSHPRILDFGCGRGWFTERLADLGEAHGIDLSPDGIAAAKLRRPDINYLAGNVYDADLPKTYFDVVISQEVIAHVEDQERYVRRAAELLKPGGYFIITTGNKYIIDRLGDVGWVKQPPQHIRHELTKEQLRDMLLSFFQVIRALTIIPHGSKGILRVTNSYKLNRILSLVIPAETLSQLKEKAGLGWQMIFLAQKRS